jgi:hypothetical protein
VYYKTVDVGFPSESPEALGHVVGISEHCGHMMTWTILTIDNQGIIYRSFSPACTADPNLGDDMFGGEEVTFNDCDALNIIKSCSSSKTDSLAKKVNAAVYNTEETTKPIYVFNPEDLIGRSFLDGQSDGQRLCATVVKSIEDHANCVESNLTWLINIETGEDIIKYSQLLNYLAKDDENETLWKFRLIVSHQGPFSTNHPDYKGSTFNIQVEWENGEVTSELLRLIAINDPVSCATYVRDNNLLHLPGWKQFKAISK